MITRRYLAFESARAVTKQIGSNSQHVCLNGFLPKFPVILCVTNDGIRLGGARLELDDLLETQIETLNVVSHFRRCRLVEKDSSQNRRGSKVEHDGQHNLIQFEQPKVTQRRCFFEIWSSWGRKHLRTRVWTPSEVGQWLSRLVRDAAPQTAP